MLRDWNITYRQGKLREGFLCRGLRGSEKGVAGGGLTPGTRSFTTQVKGKMWSAAQKKGSVIRFTQTGQDSKKIHTTENLAKNVMVNAYDGVTRR